MTLLYAPVSLTAQTDCLNYEEQHFIMIRASVNSSLPFTYVNVGAPGRCSESFVYLFTFQFSRSVSTPYLYKLFQSSSYRRFCLCLNTTLMKPYSIRPNMLREHGLFNDRLRRYPYIVEWNFGGLKNRFRCLHAKMEYVLNPIAVIIIIKAATLLKNLCIANGGGIKIW